MTGGKATCRRAVLRRIATLLATGFGVPAATGMFGPSIDGPRETDDRTDSRPDGLATVTVDRIVDGERVVLLCEREDAAVEQLVVPRAWLRTVEEGARLVVDVVDEGGVVLRRR